MVLLFRGDQLDMTCHLTAKSSRCIAFSVTITAWLMGHVNALASDAVANQQAITPTPKSVNAELISTSKQYLDGVPRVIQLGDQQFVVLETTEHSITRSRTVNAPEAAAERPETIEQQPTEKNVQSRGQEAEPDTKKPLEQSSDEERLDRVQFLVRRVERTVFPQPAVGHATIKLEPVILHDTPKKAKLRELMTQVSPRFYFTETPLRDVVSEIAEKCKIPVRFDFRALEDFGIDLDTPLTGDSFAEEALGPAIKRLLEPIGLTYLNDEHCILVTTTDRAAEQLETRLYPIPFFSKDADALISSIKRMFCPTCWSSVGGLGTIERVGNTLLISQLEDNHGEIFSFLQELERQQGIEHGKKCTRVIQVEDPALATHLATSLVAECNASLGERADSAAKVSAYGSRVTIQSASRPFLVFAEELVNSHKGQDTVRYEWCAPVLDSGRVQLYGNVEGATSAEAWDVFGMGGMGGGMF